MNSFFTVRLYNAIVKNNVIILTTVTSTCECTNVLIPAEIYINKITIAIFRIGNLYQHLLEKNITIKKYMPLHNAVAHAAPRAPNIGINTKLIPMFNINDTTELIVTKYPFFLNKIPTKKISQIVYSIG